MLASAPAVWLAMIGQMIVAEPQSSAAMSDLAPKAYDFRGWLAMLAADLAGRRGFYLLLSYTDDAGAAAIPLLRRGRRLFRRW